MSVGDFLRKHTHRQVKGWVEWMGKRWSRPDKTDYYLAGIICETRRSYVKSPGKVKLKDCLMTFNAKDGDSDGEELNPRKASKYPPISSRERVSAEAKNRWVKMFGGGVRVVNVPTDGGGHGGGNATT